MMELKYVHGTYMAEIIDAGKPVLFSLEGLAVDDVEEAIKTLKETGEYRILKKVVHIEWEEI